MDVNIQESTSVQSDLVSFVNLPVEMLLHIFSFLDAKFILNTLSCVCQRFNEILNDETIWKSRIINMHYQQRIYPALPVVNPDFDWRQACIDIECQEHLWKNKGESQLKHHFWKDVHFASVDAIHLLNHATVCATGGRDRSIVIWNLSESRNASEYIPQYEINPKAHTGWIWNFVSENDNLYSCSWDSYVRRWSLKTGLQENGEFKCENAVLSLALEGDVITAGLYSGRIILFDTRSSITSINFYKIHKRAVLALAMDANYIITASEDQTLGIWDRRAGKSFKDRIRLFDIKAVEHGNAFPRSMSYKNNHLYVGDSKGWLHLINPINGKFEHVQSYNIGHSSQVTGIAQGNGHVMTSSTDGTVRVLTPTNPPEIMTVLKTHGGEVTGLSYQENILATSGTNSAVELWIPDESS